MTTFKVQGGHRLSGEVTISGAKNAALPLIAAATLSSEPVTIKNAPTISDIPTMLDILAPFGVEHRFEANGDLIVDGSNLKMGEPDYEKISQIRASVLMLGPLLARLGHAKFTEPGGCRLGVRSIDVHLAVFKALGARIEVDEHYDIRADKLVGREIVLEEMSFTGTENALMAAVLAEGVTTIHLAAVEPEIGNLIDSLVSMGAKIEGRGTHTLTITGVASLHGATITVMPDRVEAATFAVAAAITGGEVTIHNYPVHSLDLVTAKLREAGVVIDVLDETTVRVKAGDKLVATSIRTDIYPGFPTDIQPLFAALMTQAEGESLVHETMYDSRFKYIGELVQLGADIAQLDPHRIVIKGKSQLKGGTITCPDIRGGAGLLLASLVSQGGVTIETAELIERGYTDIPGKLKTLGAQIEKV